jgi:protein suppressor of PHYA-105 1
MVCSAAFDRDDEYVATAGVSKRIRIFEYAAITSSACGGSGGCAAGTAAANGMGGFSHCHVGSGGGAAGVGGGGGGSNAAAGCDGIVYPVLELSSRSRLSCVVWSSYVKAQVASSDYEGVVQLWDANTGGELMQFEEHAKRAWAVDFSRLEPTRLVSSSDDGTVKLWSIHQDTSVATLQLHANVCSVQFSPENSHLLAAGCANYRLYLYDLRKASKPLSCVPGHRKAVSYVRWLTGEQLVSASTDSTVKLWSVPTLAAVGSSTVGSSAAAAASGREAAVAACLGTYTGHSNERNFIGLAVLPGVPGASSGSASSSGGGNSSTVYSGSGRGATAVPVGGYIMCGSETNEVVAYHTSMPVPITSHHFSAASHSSGMGRPRGSGGSSVWGDPDDWGDGLQGSDKQFVSCVTWNKRAGTIVAANSAGHVKVLELV